MSHTETVHHVITNESHISADVSLATALGPVVVVDLEGISIPRNLKATWQLSMEVVEITSDHDPESFSLWFRRKDMLKVVVHLFQEVPPTLLRWSLSARLRVVDVDEDHLMGVKDKDQVRSIWSVSLHTDDNFTVVAELLDVEQGHDPRLFSSSMQRSLRVVEFQSSPELNSSHIGQAFVVKLQVSEIGCFLEGHEVVASVLFVVAVNRWSHIACALGNIDAHTIRTNGACLRG